MVLSEGEDARVLRAARRLVAEDIATPIVLGARDPLERAAEAAGFTLDGVEIVDSKTDSRLQGYG